MMKYPFDPEWYENCPNEVLKIIRKLEYDILKEICLQVAKAEISEDIEKLKSLKAPLPKIKKLIKQAVEDAKLQLDLLFFDIIDQNDQYYHDTAKKAETETPTVDKGNAKLICDNIKTTVADNIQTAGFTVAKNGQEALMPIEKACKQVINNVINRVQAKTAEYRDAMAKELQQLADSGLKVIDMISGQVEHLDTRTRKDILTATQDLNSKTVEEAMKILETDLVEVSAHIGARDKGTGWQNHEDWQGYIYQWKQQGIPQLQHKKTYKDFLTTCGYGQVDGLLGVNCRHSFRPFVEGIDKRTYTDKQVEAMKGKNQPKIKFNGRTYSVYDATQYQRRLEREIEKVKRKIETLETAGLADKAQAQRIRLRTLEIRYDNFNKTSHLPSRQPFKK